MLFGFFSGLPGTSPIRLALIPHSFAATCRRLCARFHHVFFEFLSRILVRKSTWIFWRENGSMVLACHWMVRFCRGERSTFEATCLMDWEENVLIFRKCVDFPWCFFGWLCPAPPPLFCLFSWMSRGFFQVCVKDGLILVAETVVFTVALGKVTGMDLTLTSSSSKSISFFFWMNINQVKLNRDHYTNPPQKVGNINNGKSPVFCREIQIGADQAPAWPSLSTQGLLSSGPPHVAMLLKVHCCCRVRCCWGRTLAVLEMYEWQWMSDGCVMILIR